MPSESWRCDICACVYEAEHARHVIDERPACPNCDEYSHITRAGEGGWPRTRDRLWLWDGKRRIG